MKDEGASFFFMFWGESHFSPIGKKVETFFGGKAILSLLAEEGFASSAETPGNGSH